MADNENNIAIQRKFLQGMFWSFVNDNYSI